MTAGRTVGVMTQQDIKSKAKALLQTCGLYRLPVDVDALAPRSVAKRLAFAERHGLTPRSPSSSPT